MNGIINLLKPPGLSSARAVSVIRRATGQKAGHAGTLDPEACGVLPVMVGKATRLFDYLTEGDKVYLAVIAFGASTDTQDATGRVTGRSDSFPDGSALLDVLPGFTGQIMQRPPAFSAIKQGGKALYKAARQGLMIETVPRPTVIHGIELLGSAPGHAFRLRIRCGKGTYIRTLCHDIGQALGCQAHMRLLIREETAGFSISRAITLEELDLALRRGDEGGPWLRSMEDCLSHLRALEAPGSLYSLCANGAALDLDAVPGCKDLEEGGLCALRCAGQLIGVFARRGSQLAPRTMLHEPEPPGGAFS